MLFPPTPTVFDINYIKCPRSFPPSHDHMGNIIPHQTWVIHLNNESDTGETWSHIGPEIVKNKKPCVMSNFNNRWCWLLTLAGAAGAGGDGYNCSLTQSIRPWTCHLGYSVKNYLQSVICYRLPPLLPRSAQVMLMLLEKNNYRVVSQNIRWHFSLWVTYFDHYGNHFVILKSC